MVKTSIMKYITYFSLFLSALLLFSACEDEFTKKADFSVAVVKTTFDAGETITFKITNAPDWVTFFSGEEGKAYPESYGAGIKGITNELIEYSHTYTKAGTYQVVFLGGNTNYKSENEQVVKLTITIN